MCALVCSNASVFNREGRNIDCEWCLPSGCHLSEGMLTQVVIVLVHTSISVEHSGHAACLRRGAARPQAGRFHAFMRMWSRVLCFMMFCRLQGSSPACSWLADMLWRHPKCVWVFISRGLIASVSRRHTGACGILKMYQQVLEVCDICGSVPVTASVAEYAWAANAHHVWWPP